MDTIDAEARMQAGLMPMHPAILRARRVRRWRRLGVWCALWTVCLVCTEVVWADSFALPGALWMRLAAYGVLTLPVLVLNLWFLPIDRARELQFEAQWAEAPGALLEEVVRFDESQRQREVIEREASAHGAVSLVMGGVMTVLGGGVTVWLAHDKFKDWLGVLGFVAFVSGIVALINVAGPAVRYLSARMKLRVIHKEREELMRISALLPDGAALVGGLSSAHEDREKGALTTLASVDEEEVSRVESRK